MKYSIKLMSFLMAFAVCFACMPAAGISQDKMKDHKMKDKKMMKDDHMMKDQSIVQIASQNDQLSTFVKAVKSAGLAKELNENGPYTVFAPTNEAFDALPEGTLSNLMKPDNQDKLLKIIRYHIVSGSVMASDLKDGEQVMTVEGGHAMVSMGKGDDHKMKDEKMKDDDKMMKENHMKQSTMINHAKVMKADIEASNGVIHIINKVLMPSSDKMMKDNKMMKDDHMKKDDGHMMKDNKMDKDEDHMDHSQ